MTLEGLRDFDVVVVGGGPGGFSAAVSSARNGVRTLLVERYGFLGGMATAGLVNPFMKFHVGDEQIIGGVLQEVIDRLTALGGYDPRSRAFDPEVMKYVMDEIALEAGVELLYHTTFIGAVVSNRYVRAILIHNKSGLSMVTGRIFVDATGDGDLAVSAGAPFEKGRSQDGLTQPMTLNFDLADVDIQSMPTRRELNEAYSDLRSCLASALTLLSTIIALVTASIALKAWWLSLIALLLAFCSPPLVVYTRRRERDLELVKRILYGDPVGSWHYGLVKIYIAFSILILAVGLILLLLIP